MNLFDCMLLLIGFLIYVIKNIQICVNIGVDGVYVVWIFELNGFGFVVIGSKYFLYIIIKLCICSIGCIYQ